jgi:hypothetical protein
MNLSKGLEGENLVVYLKIDSYTMASKKKAIGFEVTQEEEINNQTTRNEVEDE